LLKKNEEAIAKRWLDDVLSTYSDKASVTFKKEKDPFANPVGNSLRLGTQGICEVLFGEGAIAANEAEEIVDERIHGYLCEIVKIRAVQEFSASQALGFVFQLKKSVRGALGRTARDASFAADLGKLDDAVDHIALAAFDIFAQYREQVFELRVNEVKRRVSWVVEKLNKRQGEEPAPADTE